MSKQLYFDGFLCGLIKVKPVRRLDGGKFRVEVMEDKKAYRKGEELDCYGSSLVNKTGRRTSGGHILVATADSREYFGEVE